QKLLLVLPLRVLAEQRVQALRLQRALHQGTRHHRHRVGLRELVEHAGENHLSLLHPARSDGQSLAWRRAQIDLTQCDMELMDPRRAHLERAGATPYTSYQVWISGTYGASTFLSYASSGLSLDVHSGNTGYPVAMDATTTNGSTQQSFWAWGHYYQLEANGSGYCLQMPSSTGGPNYPNLQACVSSPGTTSSQAWELTVNQQIENIGSGGGC